VALASFKARAASTSSKARAALASKVRTALASSQARAALTSVLVLLGRDRREECWGKWERGVKSGCMWANMQKK
jgi:hypothetical protein